MARNRAAEVAQEYKNTGGGRAQHFYPVNLDVVERLGLGMYKTVVGDNFLRILPPPDSEKLYCRKIFNHEKIGTEQANILCPNRTHDANNKPMGQPCPICDFATELYKADNKSEVAKALFAKERWLYFVVNTKDEKTETQGPCWYSASSMIHDNIRDLSTNPRDTSKAVDISDAQTGQDLKFKRVGIQFSAFQLLPAAPIPEQWYKDLPTFTELLYFTEEAEMLRHLSTSGTVKQEEAPAANNEVPNEPKKTETAMPARTRNTAPVETPAPVSQAAVEPPQTESVSEVSSASVPGTNVEVPPPTKTPPIENTSASNQVAAKLAEFQKRRAAATKGK